MPPPRTKRQRLLGRLVACCAANVTLLLLTGLLIFYCCSEGGSYFRFGPGFTAAGVKIDTWSRYVVLHAVLLVTQTVDMLVPKLNQ